MKYLGTSVVQIYFLNGQSIVHLITLKDEQNTKQSAKTKGKKSWLEINCRIILEPQEGTRPIYKKNERKIEPFMVGEGDLDYICGRCDNVIVQSVSRSQIATRSISMSKLSNLQ